MEARDGTAGDGDEQRREEEAALCRLVHHGNAVFHDRLPRRRVDRRRGGKEAGERGDLQVGGSAGDARAYYADHSENDHAVQQVA